MRTTTLLIALMGGLGIGSSLLASGMPTESAAMHTQTDSHIDDHKPGLELLTLEHEGRTYPYAVYRSPHLATDQAPPMIVFLHGRGECGTDGTRQLAVGLWPAVVNDNKRWPAVILFPQKPDEVSAWPDHAEVVLAMMERTIQQHGVDRRRVALTGLSQGGHGALLIGARHADLFCAVAPVCGYIGWKSFDRSSGRWNPDWITEPTDDAVLEVASGLANTPVWAIHGDADDVVPASQSTFAIEAIRAVSSSPDQVQLTILPRVNHNAWDPAYRAQPLAEWLLQDRSRP